MVACDVLIVGAGPAGSTCARHLRRCGADVLLIDKAPFPRDKVCAGWITPDVIDALALDVDEYRRHRTLQAFTAFRVGLIGDPSACDVDYGRPISYAIRRSEFDQYLLDRSGARVRTGEAVHAMERRGGEWVVNGDIHAPMLVGAGGYCCPVARIVDRSGVRSPVVAAAEVEVPIRGDGGAVPLRERPELFLSPDLSGYGWCIRKNDFLNVGFGCVGGHALRRHASDFLRFLRRAGKVTGDLPPLRAHAYGLALYHRSLVADGAVLIGDAAGLARPLSGEGIGPAIESAGLAAQAIAAASGDYASERLRPYADAVGRRFGATAVARLLACCVRSRSGAAAMRRAIARPWFVRHVVLDRWFLHRQEAPTGQPLCTG